jgi:hypothetical protein
MKLTSEDAKFLAETQWWIGRPARDVAIFQMEAKLLCMPFGEFHKAIEEALGRGVYTHEFGLNWDGLKKELLGDGPAPSLDEIIAMLPADKTIIVRVA